MYCAISSFFLIHPAVMLSGTQLNRHALLGYPYSLLFTSTFLLPSAWSWFGWSSDFTLVPDIVASVLCWKLVSGCYSNLVLVDVQCSCSRGRPGAMSTRLSQESFLIWLYLDRFFYLYGVESTLWTLPRPTGHFVLFVYLLGIFLNVYCSTESAINFTLCSALFIGSIIYASPCHLHNVLQVSHN
jgi:hypothetical protein